MFLLYVFTFLAGVITVLSPCVLPVLPAILSASISKDRYRPLGVIIGLTLSFTFFTLSLTFLVHLLGISANVLRYIAIAIIGAFGLVMLVPYLSDLFASATSNIGNLGSTIQSKEKKKGFVSGLLLGSALGLVWTPCAGPILAAVTTLVATQQITLQVILLTLTYSLGAAIPLFLIAYGGSQAINKIPFLAKHTEQIRKVFGILMILTAVALAFHWETTLQQLAIKYIPAFQIENNTTVQEELKKLRAPSPFSETRIEELKEEQGTDLPKIAVAPKLTDVSAWINSEPLEIDQLKGKVILVDFWTYSCINCIRTFPYLIDWYNKYKDKGLVIIGVHTPEFEFEKDKNNVQKATERFHISYPVALDNHYKTWLAFSNRYWPAHYLIDQEGIVRQVHSGEGAYAETENAIRSLLGMQPLNKEDKPFEGRPITPETYLGIFRGDRYQEDSNLKPGEISFYTYKPPLQADHVGLKGEWLAGLKKITSKGQASSLDLNFIANRVYLVMGSDNPQKVSVLLDGKPLPSEYYTTDMDDKGYILVHEPRKYDVVNLKENYGRHTISIIMPEGVSAYAFTFGDE